VRNNKNDLEPIFLEALENKAHSLVPFTLLLLLLLLRRAKFPNDLSLLAEFFDAELDGVAGP
jgi:hypothetical protein